MEAEEERVWVQARPERPALAVMAEPVAEPVARPVGAVHL